MLLNDDNAALYTTWKLIWNPPDDESLKLMSQIINEACCNTR